MDEIRSILKEIQKSLGIEIGDNADHSSSQSVFGAKNGGDVQRSAMFDDAGAIQGTIRPTPNVPIARLSQEELQRRDNDLCYKCDEAYRFGHRCKSKPVYVINSAEEKIDEWNDTMNFQKKSELFKNSKVMTEGGGKGVPISCDVVENIQGVEEEEGVNMHTMCSMNVLQGIVYGAAAGETETEHSTV